MGQKVGVGLGNCVSDQKTCVAASLMATARPLLFLMTLKWNCGYTKNANKEKCA
jgi:hypothetical protein